MDCPDFCSDIAELVATRVNITRKPPPEEMTPVEKINQLYYRIPERTRNELIDEARGDEVLKKYLFVYLCEKYGAENIQVRDLSLPDGLFPRTNDIEVIKEKLIQLEFINERDSWEIIRDWFKLYSIGQENSILNKLEERVERDKLVKQLRQKRIEPIPINNLNSLKEKMKKVNEIDVYINGLMWVNYDLNGNYNPVNYLHNALKNMYTIEGVLLTFWKNTEVRIDSNLNFLIQHYFDCINFLFNRKGTYGIEDHSLFFSLLNKDTLLLDTEKKVKEYVDVGGIRPNNIQNYINHFVRGIVVRPPDRGRQPYKYNKTTRKSNGNNNKNTTRSNRRSRSRNNI